MCGISGLHFFNSKKTSLEAWQLEGIVNELLLGIEHRGTDSTGVATIRGNGDIWIEKAELKATEFIKHRSGLDKKVKTILLHTRYATQGHQSNLLNNHPIDYDNAVIIHNGHIRNDDELFENEDIKRNAEVDSEIIAALFNKHGIEKAHLALQKLEGGFAVAAIDQRKPTALVLAKGKGSPLVYFKNDNFIVWASLGKTIIDAFSVFVPDIQIDYKDLEYGKEGDIVFIEHGKMEHMQFKVKETPVSKNKFSFDYQKTSSKTLERWGHWDEADEQAKLNKSDEEIRKELIPRYGSYSIYPEKGGVPIVYRCCWDCGSGWNEDLMVKFDGAHYCDVCYQNQTEWLKQDDKTIPLSDEEKAEDEILSEFEQQEHNEICERIGKVVGVPATMVDYLLWDCPELLDGEVENKALVGIYETLADLYESEMEMLEDYEETLGKEIVKYSKKNAFKNFIGL